MFGDKLVEIPLDELARLDEFLQRDWPEHINDQSLVATLHRWLADFPDLEHLKIYSLNGDWSSDGLYLVTYHRDLLVHSLSGNNPRLRTALKLLDWRNGWRLSNFAERNRADILSVVKELQLAIDYQYSFDFYVCPVERALQIRYEVPEDVVLRPVSVDDAGLIDDLWPYRHPGSDVLVRTLIERNESVGAFDKASGELMGWCLIYLSQCHSIFQVRAEFARRGLGRLIAQKLAHDRALAGKCSMVYVNAGNAVSRRIFEGEGFVKVGEAHWLRTEPVALA